MLGRSLSGQSTTTIWTTLLTDTARAEAVIALATSETATSLFARFAAITSHGIGISTSCASVHLTHMKNKMIASMLALTAILTGCNKSPKNTSDSQGVQGQPYNGEIYRTADGRTTLTLISPRECLNKAV